MSHSKKNTFILIIVFLATPLLAQKAINNVYETFFNILSNGQVEGNAMLETVRIGGPSYPKQLVTKIALKAARTLDSILNEVIEIILPQDYKTLANLSMTTKSQGVGIAVNGIP